MTDRPGRGDEMLPVFDAVEPAPVSQLIPAPPRRGLGPARGAGLAAALLVLLVGGIVVGGLPKAPAPTSSSAASPSGAPVVVRPTGGTASCTPPSPARAPTLSLSVQDVPYSVDAPVSVLYPADVSPAVGETWPLPPLTGALYPRPEDKIVIGVDLGACIQTLAVTYASADEITARTGAAALFEEVFEPPAHAISFEGIRSGDWVLRAEAHFEAAAPSSAGLVEVAFFRVVAGVTPTVTDAPRVTPSAVPAASPVVACAPGSPTAAVGVRVTGGLAGPVVGVPDTALTPGIPQPPIPVVEVGLGDRLRLEVDGDYCATSWDIQLVDESGRGSHVDLVTNPADDPRVAAQDRWVIAPLNDELLVAYLHFQGGPDVARVWHVIVHQFVTPVAVLAADDGTRFDAEYSCGLEVALHNGYSSNESCAGIDYSPGEAALRVRALRPISFEIPGWSIRSWSGSCGKVADFAYTVTNGCGLGGGAAQSGGTLASPVTFVLPPGDTVVLIHADAIAPNGDQFSVDYFAHVIAR